MSTNIARQETNNPASNNFKRIFFPLANKLRTIINKPQIGPIVVLAQMHGSKDIFALSYTSSFELDSSNNMLNMCYISGTVEYYTY